MIKIFLYKNGLEIKGHAIQHICSEVSILVWNLANTISYHIADEKSEYYASINDNKENPYEGYTWLTFDIDNKKCIEVYEIYKHNLKAWAKEMWKPSEVEIIEKDSMLVK